MAVDEENSSQGAAIVDSMLGQGGTLASGWSDKTFPEFSRWLMLSIFSLLSFCNALLWITFAPISTLTEDYFEISPNEVNILSVVFMVLYIPGSIGASWFYQKFGCRNGVVIAGLFNCISAWVRCLSLINPTKNGYWLLLMGQLIAASVQPFFTNLPARLTAIWFPVQERDVATTIAVSFNVLGAALGTILPSALVDKDGGLGKVLFTEAILVSAPFLAALCFFIEEPKHPPSRTAFERRVSRVLARVETNDSNMISSDSLQNQLKTCLKDKNFIILTIGYGLSLGIFNALATLINQITRPAGYDDNDASLFGASWILSGMFGAAIAGIVLDKFHKYNETLKFCFLFGTMCTVVLTLEIRPNNTAILAVCWGILGFFVMPITVTSFSCGVECMYPVEEEITTGILMSSGQITGIVLTLVLGWLIDIQNQYGEKYVFELAYILLAATSVVANIVIIFYHGSYKRFESDSELYSSLLES